MITRKKGTATVTCDECGAKHHIRHAMGIPDCLVRLIAHENADFEETTDGGDYCKDCLTVDASGEGGGDAI